MRTLFALLLLSLPAAAATQGTAYNYCQTTLNSFGTAAVIGYTGSLDRTEQTFTLTVTGHPITPNSFGMFTCGQDQYNVPFGSGYLCISPFGPGIHRMATQHLDAVTLTHGYTESPSDFLYLQGGTSWNFQFWYRNPAAGGTGFNLSDALHVEFAQ
jgi:hypothetical protein